MRFDASGAWTLDDALRMLATLADWMRTADGTRCAYVVEASIHNSHKSTIKAPSWDSAERGAQQTAESISNSTLIWCDPPMVDMWAAAADGYPAEPLQHHHLPDPEGIVILSRPLPRAFINDRVGEEQTESISALTWNPDLSAKTVVVAAWARHRGLVELESETKMSVYAPGLRMSSICTRQYGQDPEDRTTVRLLQALTGLLRSPMAAESIERGSKNARKRAARAGITDPRIRRVYLRRPEQGRAELEAVRDTRAGRTVRGHWVAGHWKRQWYSSINEHRWVRVEGYPRGDFTLGEPRGRKARIARGDTPSDT